VGKYRLCPSGGLTSLYKEPVHPFILQRSERCQRPNPISSVSCVSSVVLMGRETGSLHLLAPLLLTGGKRADLVIRGDVVLNTIQICFWPTMLARSLASRVLVLPSAARWFQPPEARARPLFFFCLELSSRTCRSGRALLRRPTVRWN
jgi:hypothetical protein